ncbi:MULTISPECIES: hypothetical protein [Bacteria]|uniref:Uncharacterized protein n=1 Tax=Microbacterium phage Min1 TaxID=446529 RepID=A6N1W9_9CAUD|nr:hypothetical protein MPMin1_gp11 [Microbacterium phage Min1]ABR10441.1 hypothetical protein [Microbacterium phage Min1]
MSTSTYQPTFLAVEERDGRATLAGRRRFLTDIEAATAAAAEIQGRVFAIEPVEVVDITPVSASAHVRLIDVPTLNDIESMGEVA